MGAEASDGADPRECIPVFVVSDLEASLAYYREQLGFEEAFRWGEPTFYAGICRGAVAMHLTSDPDRAPRIGHGTVALTVADADAAHRELARRGARITAPIDDRPYGLRDFMVEDPDGNRLAFGSAIEGNE
ncbi:MAG TPA: VOC family protein [Myxococcota bacterium]|nr:VOC family protein [Myxococcota bacterium]